MALTICKECGHQISKSASTCPSCGKKRTSPFTIGCGIGCAILLAISFIGTFIGMMEQEKLEKRPVAGPATTTPEKKTPEPVYEEVEASSLIRIYENNEVAADRSLKGGILIVRGKIHTIGKDILDDPYVTLSNYESSFNVVQCLFDKSSEWELVNLYGGQSVKIQGKVAGKMLGNVLMEKCKIIQSKKPSKPHP
jgi:hypothetical protein